MRTRRGLHDSAVGVVALVLALVPGSPADGGGGPDFARVAPCQVFCNAMASRSGIVARPISFIGDTAATGCTGEIEYSWSFGDGTSSGQRDPVHVYSAAGDHGWSFTASSSIATCTQGGTISVSALPPMESTYLAAVAHAPGAEETAWRTDLAVVDLAGSDTGITLTFTPYDGGTPASRVVTVANGAIREWRDVLVSLFGFADDAVIKGTIRLDADRPLFIAARTYNQTSAGTFGQYMPAIAPSDGLALGDEGIVLLLRKTAAFRSNLGFLNPSAQPCAVDVDLRDHSGIPLGSPRTWTIPAGRYWQQDDVFTAFGATATEVAYASVRPQTAGCTVWAYGSVVDNASSDPTTVPVLWRPESDPQPVAAVAHAPGAGETTWRTDLALANRSGAPVAATLTFVPFGGGTPVVRTQTIADAGTTVWNDVLVDLFDFPPEEARKGAIEVAGDGPLFASSRTYNKTPAGTFGQGIPAMAGRRCLTGGDIGVIPLLRASSAFRSNLGVLNAGTAAATVAIQLRDVDGSQLGTTLVRTVAPGAYWQQDDIFAGVGAPARELAYATVQLLTPEGTVWAYGSVVDNATGDPTTVPVLVGGAGPAVDRSGVFNTTVGPAPAFALNLTQQGSTLAFDLEGKGVAIAGSGTATGGEADLTGTLPGVGEFLMHVAFANHGQTFTGTWSFDTAVPQQGTVTGTRGPRPTRNLDGAAVPMFVGSTGINLDTISQVSRFRSGEGHDFSDDFEDCRSMKHYFMPKPGVAFSDVTIHAPFDGTVIGFTDEWEDAASWKGTALGIRSDAYPQFAMTFFHIDLDRPPRVGDRIAAGQVLGTSEKSSGTATDFALWVNTPDGARLISYFDAMTDGAFAAFQARGVASRGEFVITKAERDADPLQCNGQQFANGGNLPNWVVLH